MLQPISSFFSAKASIPTGEKSGHGAVRHSLERNGGWTESQPALPLPDSTTTHGSRPSANDESVESCLEAIELWLKWEACQESLTEIMYRQRSQGQRIEALLDECERIRFQASEASKRLLEARRQND